MTLIAKLAFLALAVGWYALRIPHKRRARRLKVATSHWDLRETILLCLSGTGLGLVPIAYCLFGFRKVGEHATHPALLVAGILAAALSLVMFEASHKALGRMWSFSLELREGHQLRTDGIYAHVRHPMYSAFWLWALAQALLLPNWIAGLSGFVGFGCLYLFRVPREEAMMAQMFGEAYRDYCRSTPRVVPWKLLLRR